MLSFIVAFDQNKGIGKDGVLPWHISEDLKLFKANTLNHKIIMGRTTFQSLPNKLKNRELYVVTSDVNYQVDDVTTINDFTAFLKQHENDEEEYFICGGASIYKLAYPYCHKAYISFVKDSYQVDTYFQGFSFADWIITKEVDYPDFIYRELLRKPSL